MSDLLLLRPSFEYKEEILSYRQEFLDSGSRSVNGSSGLARYDDFDDWLAYILAIEKDQLSRQKVHTSTYITVHKTKRHVIGSIQLRHTLTEELKQHGGHIGYAIRPSERGKGYSKQQLLLILDLARQKKMSKVMVTCHKDNLPSSKTILSCGGFFTRMRNDNMIYIIHL